MRYTQNDDRMIIGGFIVWSIIMFLFGFAAGGLLMVVLK